ncbi:MAG: MFS transporter [Eubacteriaceae bacterium]|nr:MFS transporter [Eubacteriaceae bacterium]
MSQQNPAVQVETEMTLPKRIPMLWFIQGVCSSFTTFIQTYLSFFVTEYGGLTAAQMAGVLSVARIADLVCNFFGGPIIQKSNTKYGAVRPFLLGCQIVSGLGGIIAFANPNFGGLAAKFAFVIVGYCMIHFPMNFLTVARANMITKIAGPNPTNRITLTSRQNQAMQFARIITSAATLPVIQIMLDKGFNGYFLLQIVYAAIGISGAIMIFKVTDEYDKYDPDKKTASGSTANISVLDMYVTAFKQKAVWGLLLGDMVRSFGTQAIAVSVIYYYRYSCGNTLWTSVQGTLSSFVGMGASLIIPQISRRIGKRNSALLTPLICIIVYIIMIFTADGRPIVYLVIASIAQSALVISTTHGANFYIDIAEITMRDTGKDLRPMVVMIQNISAKVSFISSGPSLAWVLGRSMYDVNRAAELGGPIPDTSLFVRSWGILVTVFYVISFLSYFLLYRVDEQEAREAAAINAQRAKEAAEAKANANA